MGDSVVGRGLDNGDWTIIGPTGTQTQSVELAPLSFTHDLVSIEFKRQTVVSFIPLESISYQNLKARRKALARKH